MAINTIASTDTILTLRTRLNQTIGAINTPVFNATVVANGRSVLITSNTVFSGLNTIIQKRMTANGVATFNSNTVFNARALYKGVNLFNNTTTINASALFAGNTRVTGSFVGNRVRTTANALFTGHVTTTGALTLFNSSGRANALFTFNANTVVRGTNTAIFANAIFKGTNTSIRGNKLLVSSNTQFTGAVAGIRIDRLDNVSRNAPANGDILVYFSANSTWASGSIDGGTY